MDFMAKNDDSGIKQKAMARWYLSGPLRFREGKLYVEIQEKFVGMGTQFYGIDFIFDLVFDPGVDNIFGKDIAFERGIRFLIRSQPADPLGGTGNALAVQFNFRWLSQKVHIQGVVFFQERGHICNMPSVWKNTTTQ